MSVHRSRLRLMIYLYAAKQQMAGVGMGEVTRELIDTRHNNISLLVVSTMHFAYAMSYIP